MAASTRETLLDIIDKHRDVTAYTRATTLAWTQAQVQLHHLSVTAGEAALFQRLASHVIYANPTLRPPSDTILRGAGAQSGLWPQGVSGDLPIVLLRIAHPFGSIPAPWPPAADHALQRSTFPAPATVGR